MCSNPITFIEALTKSLNELLHTLNCHLIVSKHCHKSKWSKPSGTGIKNTTLVTFWKHALKNAYCHRTQGEGRPAFRENKRLRGICLFTLSLVAGGCWLPTSSKTGFHLTDCGCTHLDLRLFGPKAQLRKRLSATNPAEVLQGSFLIRKWWQFPVLRVLSKTAFQGFLMLNLNAQNSF